MKILLLLCLILSCSLCFAEDSVSKTESIPTNLYSGTSCVVTYKSLQPQAFIYKAKDGEVKIYFDGRVEIVGVTLDEAALVFWRKVSDVYPVFKENILKEAAEQTTRKEGGFFVIVPDAGL